MRGVSGLVVVDFSPSAGHCTTVKLMWSEVLCIHEEIDNSVRCGMPVVVVLQGNGQLLFRAPTASALNLENFCP